MTANMDVHAKQQVIGDHRHLLATSEQLQITVDGSRSPRFSAYSAEGSVEESEPSSPSAGPPANFAAVTPGIYRSSFPKLGNFEFLETLGLKTILTLVDEPYPRENKEFVHENGINHVQIPIPANKNPSDAIPPHLMAGALELLVNDKYHPLLIHCNKGKHRTGCVVACWRKMNDVPMSAIVAEYRKYAGAKARIFDEQFIEMFDESAMYKILDNIALKRATDGQPTITPPDENVMYNIMENIGLKLAADPHPLITPPNSVKDGHKC